MEKAADHFEKVIFPFFQKIKDKHRYLQEQTTLVIIDTFKGQDDKVLKIFPLTKLPKFLFPRNIIHRSQMKCQIS